MINYSMKEIDVTKGGDLGSTKATIEITGKELARIITAFADHAEHKFPNFNPNDEFDSKDLKDFVAIRTEFETLREKMVSLIN